VFVGLGVPPERSSGRWQNINPATTFWRSSAPLLALTITAGRI
jgi:hypothetical protein